MPGGRDTLAAELAEMMVGVEVAPAHPVILRHRAEHGVGDPGAFGVDKPVEPVEQSGEIRGEAGRRSAPDELVDLRRGGHARRPFPGKAQGYPLEDRSRERQRFEWSCCPFEQGTGERVGEMTDHLLDAHGAPPTGIGGAEEFDAVADFGNIAG